PLGTVTNVIKEHDIYFSRGSDAKTIWLKLQNKRDNWLNGSQDIRAQLEHLLISHEENAAQYTLEALWDRVLFRNHRPDSTWSTEVRDAVSDRQSSTARGRFLRDLTKMLLQPG